MTTDTLPVDYVCGRVLPYMHHRPTSPVAGVLDFTVHEARQLRLGGLPVMMNHNDGTLDADTGTTRALDRIGRVEGIALSGVDARVLMAIDTCSDNVAAMQSSLSVAQGLYGGLSLGNLVRVQSADGHTTSVKMPTEVSLCKTGRRYGSTIEHFMPSATTLRRLHAHEPAAVPAFAVRFGYADDLQRQGITPADADQYIDGLARLARTRLDAIRHQHAFDTSPPRATIMSSTLPPQDATPVHASESPAEPAEPVPAPVAKEPEQQQQTPPAPAVAKPVSEPVDEPMPDVRNAREMAAEALRSKEEAVKLRQQLAEAQHAQRELEGIRAAERQKKVDQFRTVLAAYTQQATETHRPKEEIDTNVSCAEEIFKVNSDKAIDLLDKSLQMCVRASAAEAKLEELQAQRLHEASERQNNAYFANVATQMTKLREQERMFSITEPVSAGTRVALSGLSADQVSALAAPSRSSSSFDQRFAAPEPVAKTQQQQQPQQHQQQPQQQQQPTVPKVNVPGRAPLIVRASETEDPLAYARQYNAEQEYVKQWKLRGRPPTMYELEHGADVEFTGTMRASATTGEQVQDMRIVRSRNTPAHIEPANFAPEWQKILDKALEQTLGNPARRMMRCTFEGEGYQ